MLTDKDLAEIEARYEAATPGPWFEKPLPKDSDGWAVCWPVAHIARNQSVYSANGGIFPAADRRFIAHARSDVPTLVAEVKRLRAIVECRPYMRKIARLQEWKTKAVQFIQSGYPVHDHRKCSCARCDLIYEAEVCE